MAHAAAPDPTTTTNTSDTKQTIINQWRTSKGFRRRRNRRRQRRRKRRRQRQRQRRNSTGLLGLRGRPLLDVDGLAFRTCTQLHTPCVPSPPSSTISTRGTGQSFLPSSFHLPHTNTWRYIGNLLVGRCPYSPGGETQGH